MAEPELKGIEQITGAVVQDISQVDTSNINSMLVGGLIVAALVVLLVWWLTRRVEPPVQPQQPQQPKEPQQ